MIRITADENTELAPTSSFPELILPYKEFNPIQSAILPYVRGDTNLIVASPTASGKTLVASMAAALAMKEGSTVLYASPFKALTEERKDDWGGPEGPFTTNRLVTLTGDYVVTDRTRAELNDADIVLLTSEMLDARGRQGKKEKLNFLNRAGVIIVDEVHLLGADRRGDRLETGLMALTKSNPGVRLVFLSATMKNASEISEWASSLNGRETVLLESGWRPSKLNVELVPYQYMGGGYREEQSVKLLRTLDAVLEEPDEITMVFVHSKDDGRKLMSLLFENQVEAKFYSADLKLDARKRMLREFVAGKLKVLVTTSAATVGINTPCKIVVVCGTKRGMTDVDVIDIAQAIGRAGRPQFGPEGFAKIVLKASDIPYWNSAIFDLPLVRSQLAGLGCLRFHIVSLIDRKVARTAPQLVKWHARSLMASQGNRMEEKDAEKILSAMTRQGIILKDKEAFKNGLAGLVASRLYFDPLGVIDWSRNWMALIDKGLLYDDTAIAWAIGRSSHFETIYTSRDNFDNVESVKEDAKSLGLYPGPHGAVVAAMYYGMRGANLPGLSPVYYMARQDAWRLVSAWKWLARGMSLEVEESYFDKVGVRFQSGASWEEAEFCQVPGLGVVRARKLVDEGVNSIWKFLSPESSGGMRETAKGILKPKQYFKIAKAILKMKEEGRIKIKR